MQVFVFVRYVIVKLIKFFLSSEMANRNVEILKNYDSSDNTGIEKKTVIFAAEYLNWVSVVLPIMAYMKKHRDNINIELLFLRGEALDDLKYNRFIYKNIIKLVDTIQGPRYYKRPIDEVEVNVFRIIKNIFYEACYEKAILSNSIFNVHSLCLEDSAKNVYGKILCSKYIMANRIYFSHTSFDSIHNTSFCVDAIEKNPKKFFFEEKGVYCVSDRIVYDLLKKSAISKKIKPIMIGVAQYDDWWIKYRLNENDKELLNIKREIIMAHNIGKKCVAVLCAQFESMTPLSEDDVAHAGWFTEEINGLKSLTEWAHDRCILFFKFHPSQKGGETLRKAFINTIYKMKNDVDYKFVDVDAIILSTLTDYSVVVGTTSVTAEVLVAGKPVVEFHKNRAWNGYYEYAQGKFGSYARLYDLSYYADSVPGFMRCVKKLHANKNIEWKSYYERIQECIKVDNKSSERAVNVIMNGDLK